MHATSDPTAAPSGFQRAMRHTIRFEGPAVNFFEGAVLGNGGLGAIVCTRPDALLVHFGHNDVWDIRVAEKHRAEIGTFRQVFDRIKALPRGLRRLTDDPWFKDYLALARDNYSKPYPRPMPCGTLVLAWDRRRPCEVLGHSVNPADGLCTVRLLDRGREIHVQILADLHHDRLWLATTAADGQPCSAPFSRIALVPDPATPKDFPACTPTVGADALGFRQVLPALEPDEYDASTGHPLDRAFRLTVRVAGQLQPGTRLNWHSELVPLGELERCLAPAEPFVACVQLDQGLAAVVPVAMPALPPPDHNAWTTARETTCAAWSAFWQRSAVMLADAELEAIWYRNLYFLRCALRRGVTCPGLFANWSRDEIGTAWHGDYHMNYNTQQPFWVTFSSNHVELHEPYVRMVNDLLLPLARRHAQEYYELPGAAFPHCAYPVEMTMCPYPTPVWGWEICETPWSVQSLWWHYRYTRDENFLRTDAFAAIKAAVEFLVAYLQRPEAHGPQWGDHHHHIFPTVSPELHAGLRAELERNRDSLIDLALTRFVFNAYTEACRVLDVATAEHDLLAAVRTLGAALPPYPTALSADRGEVFVDAPGGSPETVYNVPMALATVFPAEEHGLHSPPEMLDLCRRTLADQRVEGGNHLVFVHLQAARLSRLDLEAFKRDVRYSTLPNGTATDKCLEAGGRYADTTRFDFMANMGIWFENFALPVVLNECLLQSYRGEIRLFPNWPDAAGDAEFRTLRAVGAFLVSARRASGRVVWVEIHAEAGGELRLIAPWPRTLIRRTGHPDEVTSAAHIVFPTAPGETVRLVESA